MTSTAPLVHIGRLSSEDGVYEEYVYLRKTGENEFSWFRQDNQGVERVTEIVGPNPTLAVANAQQFWGEKGFSPLYCGTRYTLVPRDEHGQPALFCQMVASYSVNNVDGSYFDEFAGQHCYVDFAPDESLDLWYRLRENERL